jgi:hypothetical protein
VRSTPQAGNAREHRLLRHSGVERVLDVAPPALATFGKDDLTRT